MIALFSLAVATLGTFPQEPAEAQVPDGPAQISWQRSLEDALTAQKETGLPLLVVVNMDGEVFNERFAGTTYHDREFIASTDKYICVIASPDRHSARDYDALGNRIECPRFKGCTCSEHINIEPELYRRYFDKKRNAPRHVGVTPAGKILFDRFLDRRMSVAIDAIKTHEGKGKSKHLANTEDVAEMFRRRDTMARSLLERRYRKGNKDERSKLLKAAAKAKNDPIDLLRMGLRDPDEDLVGLAAIAISRVGGPNSLIDIEDALARISNDHVRRQLIEQLRKLGKTDSNAARMASNFESSKDQLARPWRNAWQDTKLTAREGIEAELDRVEAAIRGKPKNPALRLQLATAQAAFATMLMAQGGQGIGFWLADAERNAGKVEDESLEFEKKALLAITSWYQSKGSDAQKAMVEAMASGSSTREPDAWLAAIFLDVVLQITAQNAFARARADNSVSLRGEITRTRTVLDLIGQRDAGLERGTLAGIALFEHAGLRAEARTRLEHTVQRFPASLTVHDRWRNRMMVDLGAELMRHRYAKHVTEANDRATAQWYAGYAALIAAERHTLDSRNIEAENAYADSIERFADSAASNESYADTANHYAVLALAGRAQIRLQKKNLTGAAKDILRAIELRVQSLDEDDGLKRKPRSIGSRIQAALATAGKAELAEQLANALDQ